VTQTCAFNTAYKSHHKASTVIKDPTHAAKVEVVPMICKHQLVLQSYDALTLFVYKRLLRLVQQEALHIKLTCKKNSYTYMKIWFLPPRKHTTPLLRAFIG